jgi:hypothetical protein
MEVLSIRELLRRCSATQFFESCFSSVAPGLSYLGPADQILFRISRIVNGSIPASEVGNLLADMKVTQDFLMKLPAPWIGFDARESDHRFLVERFSPQPEDSHDRQRLNSELDSMRAEGRLADTVFVVVLLLRCYLAFGNEERQLSGAKSLLSPLGEDVITSLLLSSSYPISEKTLASAGSHFGLSESQISFLKYWNSRVYIEHEPDK